MRLSFGLLIGLCFLLLGCAADGQAKFLQGEATYTAALQLAANYVALPRCGSVGATSVCSEQAVVDRIRPAANSADAAVQAAEDAVSQNPDNKSAVEMAVAAAADATSALQAIMTQYNIKVN